MELVTLGPNYQPAKLIENYDSLIWTERYNTIGDFQLKTGNVEQFMQILPEGTLLGLRDSAQIMIVETHQITRQKNKPTELTIKGRAFESILDRRVSINAVVGGGNDWSVVGYQPSDAAYYTMTESCKGEDGWPDAGFTFVRPLDYMIPNVFGPTRSYSIPRGNLLATVLTFLQTEVKADPTTTPPTKAQPPCGIRSERPIQSTGNASNLIQMYFYKGQDLSDKIYFDATRDLLDDGSYLFSKVGSANTAYVLGSQTAVVLNGSGSAARGLDRRVILVDGSTSGIQDQATLTEQGKISLSEAKATSIFDGSINQDLSPYIYGKDYRLGDIVKLVGDYGLSQKARVTEFIRSEDSTGVKAYPTLVAIEQ